MDDFFIDSGDEDLDLEDMPLPGAYTKPTGNA